MLVSDFHRTLPCIPKDIKFVHDLISSKDNKDLLMSVLMKRYQVRLSNEADNVLSELLTVLNETVQCYEVFFVPKPCYRDSFEYISHINHSILDRIIDRVKPNYRAFDYLYTQKGPGFKDEIIGNNRHPLLKMGDYGPVTNIQLPRNQLSYVRRNRVRPELLK